MCLQRVYNSVGLRYTTLNNGIEYYIFQLCTHLTANLAEPYSMDVTPLTWVLMKSSAIINLIISPFLELLLLFTKTVVDKII